MTKEISLRTAVDVLLNRVDELTQHIVENGLVVPPWEASDQTIIEQVCASLEVPMKRIMPLPQSHINFIPQRLPDPLPQLDPCAAIPSDGGISTLSQVPQGSLASNTTTFDWVDWTQFPTSEPWELSPSDWPWQILSGFSSDPSDNHAMARDPLTQDQLPVVQRQDDLLGGMLESNETSEDEVDTDIAPGLAARLGSLHVATDGRLRFYGTASNYHFLLGSRDLLPRNDHTFPDAKREALLALEHAKLDRDVPIALEDRLLELFFKWHNPCHVTVDRATFKVARTQDRHGQGTFCSQSLVAAMCALGAAFEGRYHQSFVTFPQPLADFFAAKSKVLLEVELDSPCVSTVQTLLLLSSHEAAGGRDARMWLYSGMAMRLAFDLGLHVDGDPYVEQGVFTAQEGEARRSTFWSCVVVNHLWGFSLGRPFRVDSEEITVKRSPRTGSLTDSERWTDSLTTSTATSPLPSVSERSRESSYLVVEQWVSFCEELAPLVRTLLAIAAPCIQYLKLTPNSYGCAKISKAALQELSMQTTNRLLSWQEAIPDAIKVQPHQVALPQVLLLHMGYHNFCILIHRPWTSKASQPRGGLGPGYQHARTICRKSASAIASLLREYEANYSLRTMNVYVVTIIFSASVILIFGLIAEDMPQGSQSEDEKLKIAGDLNTCFRALDELCQSFECAKRTRDFLLAIQRRWTQSERDPRMAMKRRSQLHDPGQESSYKKSKSHQRT
ncbi:hypothetical protein LTS03_003743 [Exophiala xenobiotica]|nr:hypothetical protein LTR61_004226 [Exophiala xenobiotica]KAK5371478.1 hypothetical protein LTR11_006505 [Exophiala xenobiotica]KAK5380904.1 hypothetical protein LTS03_003743 [Exophiala xenobiotica]